MTYDKTVKAPVKDQRPFEKLRTKVEQVLKSLKISYSYSGLVPRFYDKSKVTRPIFFAMHPSGNYVTYFK